MNNQLFGRERDRKRDKELEGELTGYVDTYRKAIHYGDIVNIKFELCDEMFTVTEETVGRLKTAMEIKVITRYNKT